MSIYINYNAASTEVCVDWQDKSYLSIHILATTDILESGDSSDLYSRPSFFVPWLDNNITRHHQERSSHSPTWADWFLSSQKQELQSWILRPRLVLAKQPVKTEFRQNFWSDLSGHRASPAMKYDNYLGSRSSRVKIC